MKSKHPEEFARFWVRGHAGSLRFSRLCALLDLSPSEQLFAAILRNDKVESERLITTATDQDFSALIEIVEASTFASGILSRLIESDLFNRLSDKAKEKIRKLALQGAVNKKASDKTLAMLLDIFEPVRERIVWVKGSALSRTVYSGDDYRASGDIDIVAHPSALVECMQLLERAGFTRVTISGMCSQAGVGPIGRPVDLTLTPHPELIQCTATAFRRGDCPLIDLKFGPFDRGVQMAELMRFFSDAIEVQANGKPFLIPSLPDNCLIAFDSLAKDRFDNWKTLFDIHLLTVEMAKAPSQWTELLRRIERESLQAAAWISLEMARDRFSSPVPDSVLVQLKPRINMFNCFGCFTVSYPFVWNATSLPVLLMNAGFSSDGKRKRDLLLKAFIPADQFLADYYGGGKPIDPLKHLFYLIVHWLVIIFPGGIIRRTVGQIFWTDRASGTD